MPKKQEIKTEEVQAFAQANPSIPRITMNTYEMQDAEKDHIEERTARQANASAVSAFILAASRPNTVLNATVAGIDAGEEEAYWVCYQSSVTIRIPFEEAYQNTQSELLGKNTRIAVDRQLQLLAKSIGISTPFVVTSFIEEGEGKYVAIASRRKALDLIRRRYIGDSAVKPLEVGMNVNAQIISCGHYAAVVSFCGMDVRVPNRDMTHKYLPNLATEYATGTEIKMRVISIDTKDPANPIVTVSRRPLELERSKQYQSRVNPDKHPVFAGTVTTLRRVRTPKGVVIRTSLWLDGVELPAFASESNIGLNYTLTTGDKVLLRVNGFTDSGYVHGKIIRKVGR